MAHDCSMKHIWKKKNKPANKQKNPTQNPLKHGFIFKWMGKCSSI